MTGADEASARAGRGMARGAAVEYLTDAVLALAVVFLITVVGMHEDRALYPVMTMVIPIPFEVAAAAGLAWLPLSSPQRAWRRLPDDSRR